MCSNQEGCQTRMHHVLPMLAAHPRLVEALHPRLPCSQVKVLIPTKRVSLHSSLRTDVWPRGDVDAGQRRLITDVRPRVDVRPRLDDLKEKMLVQTHFSKQPQSTVGSLAKTWEGCEATEG